MPLYKDFVSSSFPETIVPSSRFGSNPPRISNSNGVGAESVIIGNTLTLFPVFIPKQISMNTIQIRTSGSATYWPNATSIYYATRWYSAGPDGLPDTAITSQNTNVFSAGTGTNTWVTAGSGYPVFERGVYWFGIGSVANSFGLGGAVYSSSIESTLLTKIVGSGATQTSTAMSLATALDGTGTLPSSLSSRFLDCIFATVSLTTLRLRSSCPAIWISYN